MMNKATRRKLKKRRLAGGVYRRPDSLFGLEECGKVEGEEGDCDWHR